MVHKSSLNTIIQTLGQLPNVNFQPITRLEIQVGQLLVIGERKENLLLALRVLEPIIS